MPRAMLHVDPALQNANQQDCAVMEEEMDKCVHVLRVLFALRRINRLCAGFRISFLDYAPSITSWGSFMALSHSRSLSSFVSCSREGEKNIRGWRRVMENNSARWRWVHDMVADIHQGADAGFNRSWPTSRRVSWEGGADEVLPRNEKR